MPSTTPTALTLATVSDTPDLVAITAEMRKAIDQATDFYDRNERALDVRECYWPGQSPDGRKHGSDSARAFPWENASDTRIRTADMIISERVMLKIAALARMSVQIVPTKAGDTEFAQRMQSLLRWYLHNEMADEADSEIELLATYQETFGSAVLGVNWLQTLGYEEKHIELEQIAQVALQNGGPQLLADVGQMLFDPAQEETMVGWIQSFSSLLTKADARQVYRDLRDLAAADVKMPFVAESRPTITALQCMFDVVFPVNTSRLQQARWIAQRELLTAADLQAKAEGRDGWDPDFVQEVLEKGPGQTFNGNLVAQGVSQRLRELGGFWGTATDDAEDLYEVWHFHARQIYRGIPTIYRTILHPGCCELAGRHEVLPYAHGEYPYVEFVREHRSRSILASRGWPELIDTHQQEIKVQRDSRTDRASITTSPMMRKEPKVGKDQYAFGPGVVLSAKRGEIEPVVWPSADNTSLEVEVATKRDINEFVGRRGEGVDPQLVGLKEQHEVSQWLKRWQQVGTQLLKLAQQFTPETTIGQVTGLIPKPYDISRENIAGDFRLLLSFDPRFTSTDWVFGVLERLEKYVLPMDTNAVVNRDAVIKWAMAGIDPTLADLAVQDSSAAAQNEIEDELKNVALLVSGVNPPMKLQGQNFAARLNVLQQVFQQNQPFYQALLQQRPDFQANVQNRIKFLEQQIAQQKNKQIGVYGTTPSASSPGMDGAMAAPAAPSLGAFAQ